MLWCLDCYQSATSVVTSNDQCLRSQSWRLWLRCHQLMPPSICHHMLPSSYTGRQSHDGSTHDATTTAIATAVVVAPTWRTRHSNRRDGSGTGTVVTMMVLLLLTSLTICDARACGGNTGWHCKGLESCNSGECRCPYNAVDLKGNFAGPRWDYSRLSYNESATEYSSARDCVTWPQELGGSVIMTWRIIFSLLFGVTSSLCIVALMRLWKAERIHFNLQTLLICGLLCHSFIDFIYYSTDPFAHWRNEQSSTFFLYCVTPLELSVFNMTIKFLSDLSAKAFADARKAGKRSVTWVAASLVGCYLLLILCVWQRTQTIYFGIYLVFFAASIIGTNLIGSRLRSRLVYAPTAVIDSSSAAITGQQITPPIITPPSPQLTGFTGVNTIGAHTHGGGGAYSSGGSMAAVNAIPSPRSRYPSGEIHGKAMTPDQSTTTPPLPPVPAPIIGVPGTLVAATSPSPPPAPTTTMTTSHGTPGRRASLRVDVGTSSPRVNVMSPTATPPVTAPNSPPPPKLLAQVSDDNILAPTLTIKTTATIIAMGGNGNAAVAPVGVASPTTRSPSHPAPNVRPFNPARATMITLRNGTLTGGPSSATTGTMTASGVSSPMPPPPLNTTGISTVGGATNTGTPTNGGTYGNAAKAAAAAAALAPAIPNVAMELRQRITRFMVGSIVISIVYIIILAVSVLRPPDGPPNWRTMLQSYCIAHFIEWIWSLIMLSTFWPSKSTLGTPVRVAPYGTTNVGGNKSGYYTRNSAVVIRSGGNGSPHQSDGMRSSGYNNISSIVIAPQSHTNGTGGNGIGAGMSPRTNASPNPTSGRQRRVGELSSARMSLTYGTTVGLPRPSVPPTGSSSPRPI